LITADKETELYGYMRGKADFLGCMVHAINGVEDHIHIVVSIPPKLSVADFVQQIKGSSAYHMNHHIASASGMAFGWQRGYGVFTLGGQQLEQARAYVINQKEHHARGTTIRMLEMEEP
jgi:putative transposase